MAFDVVALLNAVNNAVSPEARVAAAKNLGNEIVAAVSRGVDISQVFGGAIGNADPIPIGPAQLAAIGQVQRYLAALASSEIVATPSNVYATFTQLAGVLGGVSLPGIPGIPQFPGLPFAIPQLPGLDACKFIKCLAASIDCSCGQDGGGSPGANGKGDDPIADLVNTGIGFLKRARDLAGEKQRQFERDASDFAAAAKAATGAAKEKLEAEAKEAKGNATSLVQTGEKMTESIGTAIASHFL